MKKDFVCQEDFWPDDFGHKICGAVSVMIEGVYWVGQSSG